MALAEFEGNRFRIDGEIAENHAILVNLTASNKVKSGVGRRNESCRHKQMATFRCSECSFFNIYITNILLLSPHVAMWRPLAHLCTYCSLG